MKTAKTDLLPVLTQEADQLQKQVDTFKVIDEDTLSTASDMIRRAKDVAKRIKGDKERFTAPAKAIIDAAKEKYDPLIKLLDGVEAALKNTSQAYMLVRDAKRREDEKKISDKLAAGAIKPETAMKKLDALPQDGGARTASSGLRMITRKDVEVFAPAQIPMAYHVIDMVKLRKDVLAGVEVPGARIIEKTITQSV